MKSGDLQFPVLLADIGGTNARFRLLEGDNAPARPDMRVVTAQFPTLEDAMEEICHRHDLARPRSIVFAIAAPVKTPPIRLTNAHWQIDPPALCRRFGLSAAILLNDFEAQALALADCGTDHFAPIGQSQHWVRADGPKIVMGAGTGLGAAALLPVEGRFLPVCGEAGHMAFGPLTSEEFQLWPHIDWGDMRPCAEALLSGTGLVRIAHGLSARQGASRQFASAGEITRAADAGETLALQTIALFARFMGRFCGDIALAFLARGGAYIAGGIGTKMTPYLHNSDFRAAFEHKQPLQHIMRAIPTYLVRHDNTALYGLAGLVRAPHLFVMNLEGRFWTG